MRIFVTNGLEAGILSLEARVLSLEAGILSEDFCYERHAIRPLGPQEASGQARKWVWSRGHKCMGICVDQIVGVVSKWIIHMPRVSN